MDAVGVTDNPKVETGSTEREPSIPLERLLKRIADGKLDAGTVMTTGTRLKRLEKRLSAAQLEKIKGLAGMSLTELAEDLMDACDPDRLLELAKTEHHTDEPSREQVKSTFLKEAARAAYPIASSPDLRKTLLERPGDEIIYDHLTKDEVMYSGVDIEKATALRQSFKAFLKENRDKVIALQILYSQPHADKDLTLQTIKDLDAALKGANLSAPVLWSTVAQLEPDKVTRKSPRGQLTDLVSLIRFEIGKRDTLLPFEEEVRYKLEAWLERKKKQGVSFTDEQKAWLNLIAEHVATSLQVTKEDFKHTRFKPKGGVYKAVQVFGRDKLFGLVDELNRELTA